MHIYELDENKPWEEVTADDLGGRREDTALVIRYGGFGDMIMMSSVLPTLKDHGWRVCVNTSKRPPGLEYIKADPNVDEVILQQRDWVSAHRLSEWWDFLGTVFPRVINLSESIEGRLLAIGPRTEKIDGDPQPILPRPEFFWPHEKRHLFMNRNYIEETFKIAGLPFHGAPRTAFYPTELEVKRARRRLDKIRKKTKTSMVVMWVLSGSSVHKAYPWMDYAIMNILRERPDTAIITVGDTLCQLLERGWEQEKRVVCRADKWSMRDTVTMAQLVDVVVGPETGVLNAVSMIPAVKKVCLLSHSSEENLTKHWKNTVALTPSAKVPCYPCHQMHYGREHCTVDPQTHAAMCAADIPHAEVVAHVIGGEMRYVEKV